MASQETASFEIVSIPPERAIVVDAGILGSQRHIMYGLAEVDVTKARKIMRERSVAAEQEQPNAASSEEQPKKPINLSFTAYLVACLARAVEQEPRVQGYKVGWNKQVNFHDVHVSTMIEAKNDKGGVAIPHVIRNANKRTVQDISEEIHNIKNNPEQSEQKSGNFVKLATKIPRWVRMLFFRWMMSSPENIQKNCGTIMLTSVGMMLGKGHGGWCIAHLPIHTTGVTVGGIHKKPAVLEDGESIGVREFLCITVAFDHDIVDGAPAARFASHFVELIEKGSLLVEE